MFKLFRQTQNDAAREKPAPAKPARPSELVLTHDGVTIHVAVKRVASARRFTLRVRGATRDAVLTMPRRATLKDAREFAERHAAWVGVRLDRLPRATPFIDGTIFPLRGISTRIIHSDGARGLIRVERVTLNDCAALLHVGGASAHVERRVLDYLKRESRRDFEIATERCTAQLGIKMPPVKLRDTVSRWGSCSSAGTLNFSWRLILAPAFVLEYLAAHEVAHLKHMDHSARYWRVCHALFPRTDEAETWLKHHGASLHRWGTKKTATDHANTSAA